MQLALLEKYFCLQDKVDVVKTTMQDNIQQMLSNEERLDQISQNAEGLNEQVSGVLLVVVNDLWSARDGPPAGSTMQCMRSFLGNRGFTGTFAQ